MLWGQSMMYGPSRPDFHGMQGPSLITSASRAEPSNEAAQGLSAEYNWAQGPAPAAATTVWPQSPPEE